MEKVPVLLEYIWIDGSNNLRSKNRVIFVEKHLSGPECFLRSNLNENIQMWNFDGSSTGQADVACSEVNLKPVKTFIDPFLFTSTQMAYLVLCETYSVDGKPHNSNTRDIAHKVFLKHLGKNFYFFCLCLN
jgi:glutamine synthetase